LSVNRRDLVRHLEKNGYFLRREGGRHSIYANGAGKIVPVKRHSEFDRITANEICKQAGVSEIF
jgi:predicted RNA binding protein YcfA (HicA-like mRNA interferase family)